VDFHGKLFLTARIQWCRSRDVNRDGRTKISTEVNSGDSNHFIVRFIPHSYFSQPASPRTAFSDPQSMPSIEASLYLQWPFSQPQMESQLYEPMVRNAWLGWLATLWQAEKLKPPLIFYD
jgi:hypothetical protein